MTEPRDYTAHIARKGLDGTGVTEDIARSLYSRLDGHLMAIVELKVDGRADTADGSHKVALSVVRVEPAMDNNLSEHLRELTRTLYYNRQVANGDQPTLETPEGTEPTVDAVLSAGQQHRPHPYIASQLALEDDPVCDVCGRTEDAGVHQAKSGIADPFTVPTDEDEDQADDEGPEELEDESIDEENEPHEYVDDDGSCRLCGRHEGGDGAAYHVLDEDPADEPETTRHLASVKERR